MDAASLVLWITVISIFVILFASVAYLFSRDPAISPPVISTNPTVTSQVNPTLPTIFTYSCSSNKDCQTGLTCDSLIGECRVPENGICNYAADCVTNLYCSGICLSTTEKPNLITILPGDPCPCSFSYSCVSDPTKPDSGKNVCLKNEGTSCTNDSECISDLCTFGTCALGKSNGYSCQTNQQCLSDNCSLGYCQPLGTITGEENSTCIPSEGLTCTGERLICSIGGICVPSTNGLLFPCSNNVGCPSYFGCYYIPSPNSKGVFPNPGSSDGFNYCDPLNNNGEGCVCLFNTDTTTSTPKPNHASPFDGCLSGYSNINNLCYAPENNPCEPSSSVANGGCTETCAISGKIYRLDFEFSSGIPGENNLGCYPLTGAVGGTSLKFNPIDIPVNISVNKIIGITEGFKLPDNADEECTSLDRGTDLLYIVSFAGRNINIPNDTTVIWKYNNSDKSWVPVLPLVFTATLPDRTTRTVKFTNADVSLYQSTEILAVTGTVQGGSDNGKDILLKLNSLNGDITALISKNNGFPVDESNNLLNFDGVSVSDTQTNPAFPGVLLISSSGPNVFFNNLGDTFVGRGGKLTGADPFNIQLNYGLNQTSNGLFTSFPILTFVSGVNGNKFLRFSESLDGNSTKTYSGIKYPNSLYGMSTSYITVNDYSISNVNPLVYNVQNGILSSSLSNGGDNTLFIISAGSVSAIPGYVPKDAKYLVTTSNIYIYSPNSCVNQ